MTSAEMKTAFAEADKLQRVSVPQAISAKAA
jgi:hypothetical protein